MNREQSEAVRAELSIQTRRIVESLSGEARTSAGWQDESEPEASLIGIVGERGSGKTTLLRHVTESLRSEGEFEVLPVLRPEILAVSEDSLLLAAVNALVTFQPDETRGLVGADQLAAAGQRALRSAIFAVAGSVGELFESSGSLGQFAVDSASVLGRVSSLHRDLETYVQDYLKVTGRKGIIVPVDDIDLIPASLSKLLIDVRTLASLPGVYPIVCLSWDDLRANLRAEVATSFGAIGAAEVDRLVEQQVMKTLRPDRVFEPLQLPRVDRLKFIPIGETVPLGTVLEDTFSASDPGGDNGLRDWFSGAVGGGTRSATLATGWLPGTYRALEHLYYQSKILQRAFHESPGGLEAAHQLRAFVDSVARGSGVRRLTLEFHSVDTSRTQPLITATADWPSYRLGIASDSRWSRVHRAGGVRVRLRKAVRLIGTEVMLEESTSGASSDGTREASESETIGSTLAQTLLSSTIFSSPRPSGPLSLGESSCEFLQSVQVVGLPTSDRILLLPASADIVHIDRWFSSWNWVVDKAHVIGEHGAPLTHAVKALCDATTQIWWHGLAPEAASSSTSLLSAFESAAQVYVELVSDENLDANWRTSPAKAYCEWFEMLLPQSFHEALMSEEDLRGVLAVWQAALSSSPTGEEALDRLHDLFERRVESTPGRAGPSIRDRIWLYGYRSLARSLGESLIVGLNQFEKEYRERERKGARGTGAVGDSVLLEQTSHRYRFASETTAAGVSQFHVIMRLLDQLRRT